MIARPVQALTLAVLLGAGGGLAHAQSLGRLFYTPEQRVAITQARLRGTPADAATMDADMAPAAPAPAGAAEAGASPAAAPPSMPAAPPGIVLSGILDRAGGRIAWLDGTAVRHGQTWRGYRVEVGARSVRLLRAGAPPRVLGIGQRLDLVTGEVSEPLAPGAVRRTRR
ncbi:MAG: hypothetical protein ACOY37_10560 [Pseudomonadota bacterium]